jgi:hypothetical protein
VLDTFEMRFANRATGSSGIRSGIVMIRETISLSLVI